MAKAYDFDAFMADLKRKNPGEPEFHQAVQEIVEVLIPFINDNKKFQGHGILERMTGIA